MMRLGVALAAAVGLAAAVQAAGYDDYARGMSAFAVGNTNIAIAAFSAALAAGDLALPYVPDAYARRASAYLRIGKCGEALSDLNAADRQKPSDAHILALRAAAQACLGHGENAETDFAAALARKPSSRLYYEHARYLWTAGNFADAADKFSQAMKLADRKDRHASYAFVWYAVTARRAGRFDAAGFGKADEIKDGSPAFKTLDLEGASVSTPEIRLVPNAESQIMGESGQPKLILGMNILRQLHLYISFKEHLIYATAATAR
jgi:tetratricopeptide (TPR) repeat protein